MFNWLPIRTESYYINSNFNKGIISESLSPGKRNINRESTRTERKQNNIQQTEGLGKVNGLIQVPMLMG